MQLDQALDHGEAEAGALELPVDAAVQLLEGAKQPQLVRGRDADARVDDGEFHLLVHTRHVDADGAALGRELHRVREQVVDDLPELAAIGLDGSIPGRDGLRHA